MNKNLYAELGHEKYQELCADLAELYIVSDLTEMMIPVSESKIKARAYRNATYGGNNEAWQKFEMNKRYMSEAINGLNKLGYEINKNE